MRSSVARSIHAPPQLRTYGVSMSPHRMRVIAVVNFKGGAGKSTTAGFLLRALRRPRPPRFPAGMRVAGVDGDSEADLVDWSSVADWPYPVVGLAVPSLDRRLPGVLDPGRVDAAVIDTPPLNKREGVVRAAIRAATDIVVTMAPTVVEVRRTEPIWPAIAEETDSRDGPPPNVWVLLTRTVARAGSTQTVREQLAADGHRVLTATIPRLERYAQAWGGPAEEVPGGPYEVVTDEIVRTWA
jgi:chromosome partitioning protein